VGEETFEGIGLQQVVDALRPDLVVIGEPTHCNLGFGQRGRARVTFRVPGRAAHSSSDDQSGNAVYAMAALAEKLSRHTFPSDPSLGRGSHAPIELISQPFPSLSTVPVECRLTLDRRLMAGETEESVLEDYRSVAEKIPGAAVEMDRVTYTSYTGVQFIREDFHPAWDSGKETAFVQNCLAALHSVGISAELYPVPYCTNASYSAGVLGIHAVVFGPGDITQAHATNEYIETAEVIKAAKGYAALTHGLC
jgi:putative selenium metabolism hydrolase